MPGVIDAEQISWDAWRTEDRRWSIEVRWPSEDESAAHFEFDQRGRFSVAHDEAARMLIDTARSRSDGGGDNISVAIVKINPG